MITTSNSFFLYGNSRSIGCNFFISHFLLLLSLLTFPQLALAKSGVQHNISYSWFKPYISVNNDSSVCTPLLNGYLNAFQSQFDNPMSADVYGTREPTPAIGIIRDKLNEIPWEELKSGDSVLRVANHLIARP